MKTKLKAMLAAYRSGDRGPIEYHELANLLVEEGNGQVYLDASDAAAADVLAHSATQDALYPGYLVFPKRDQSKPAEQQGVFQKFDVRRTDGSSEPGGKHHGCSYFVLDVDHDALAKPALQAYAAACAATYPDLSADMVKRFDLAPPVAAGSVDTPVFQELMNWFRTACFDPYSNTETKAVEHTRRAIITHIDAWGALQRQAGKVEAIGEMMASNRHLRQRAEKAEAELESWVHSNRIDELQRSVVAAEARVNSAVCVHCRMAPRPTREYCPASTEDTRFQCQAKRSGHGKT